MSHSPSTCHSTSSPILLCYARLIRGSSGGLLPARPVPRPLGRGKCPGERAHGGWEGEETGRRRGGSVRTIFSVVPCRCSLRSSTWFISTQNMEASEMLWTSLMGSQYSGFYSRFLACHDINRFDRNVVKRLVMSTLSLGSSARFSRTSPGRATPWPSRSVSARV